MATCLEQPVPAIESPSPARRSMSLGRREFIAGTVVAAIVAFGVTWWLTQSEPPVGPQVNLIDGSSPLPGSADSAARVMRTSINLGLMDRLPAKELHIEIALSPDGYRLLYLAFVEGRRQLYVRELDELESRAIGALRHYWFGGDPFFSADGEWVAFNDGYELMKIPVRGGRSQTVADTSIDAGGFWTSE